MSLLNAKGLTKHYGERAILDGVAFTVDPNARIGLIGRNGAGKSTLIRILAGELDADDGTIERRRNSTIAVVEQAPRLALDRSVADALQTGLEHHNRLTAALEDVTKKMHDAEGEDLDALIEEQAAIGDHLERIGYDVEHKVDAMIDHLKIPPKSRTLGSLSLGEQRRVALAIGLLTAPDFLVLDEPTNHLDVETIVWLQNTLAKYAGALLLVTHDRYFLDEVATRIVELDRGALHAYDGNYTEYLVLKAEREAMESRIAEKRIRAIEEELKWVRASAPARTTKQKARLDRFDALVENRPKAAMGEVTFSLPHPPRLGKIILELEGLTKGYDGRTLIDRLSLKLKPKDRIGILGPNGAGKSTLLKMILGEVEPDAGTIRPGLNTKVVYADQARADLDPDRTVLEEVAGDNDKVFVGDRAVQVQSFLDGLLFDGALQRTKVGALSGGEKSRVSLAKSLRETGNLLILDEPTNDLDLATLRVLEDALVEYPGCSLIVSHDRYFLDRVTTAILAFEGDGRVTLYEGRYSTYLSLKPEEPVAEEPPKAAPPPPPPPPKPKKARTRRTHPEQREFEAMEDKILEAESEVEALEAKLADPDAIKALGAQVGEAIAELEAKKSAVEQLYARWSALSELEPYGG
ncbi:MAG: ABC-F family ATP-binding cassette domain-containing protein [Deltaproteobacteria bacterium]